MNTITNAQIINAAISNTDIVTHNKIVDLETDELYLTAGKNEIPENNVDNKDRFNTFVGRGNKLNPDSENPIENSFVAGTGNIISKSNQVVIGQYNEISDSPFIIGNGDSNENRKNLFQITQNGGNINLDIENNNITVRFRGLVETEGDFPSGNLQDNDYIYKVITIEGTDDSPPQLKLTKYIYSSLEGWIEIYTTPNLYQQEEQFINDVLSSGLTSQDKEIISKLYNDFNKMSNNQLSISYSTQEINQLTEQNKKVNYSSANGSAQLDIILPTNVGAFKNDAEYVNEKQLEENITQLENKISNLQGRSILPFAARAEYIAGGTNIDEETLWKYSEYPRQEIKIGQETTGKEIITYYYSLKGKFLSYGRAMYHTLIGDYSLLTQEPLDWEENYNDYYFIDTKYDVPNEILKQLVNFGLTQNKNIEEDEYLLGNDGHYFVGYHMVKANQDGTPPFWTQYKYFKKIDKDLNHENNTFSVVNDKQETLNVIETTYIYRKNNDIPAGWYVLSSNTISGTFSPSPQQIDAMNSGITKEKVDNIFNLIYPIGCYYWSSDSTNPHDLFGGTWEQVKDRFILAAGDENKPYDEQALNSFPEIEEVYIRDIFNTSYTSMEISDQGSYYQITLPGNYTGSDQPGWENDLEFQLFSQGKKDEPNFEECPTLVVVNTLNKTFIDRGIQTSQQSSDITLTSLREKNRCITLKFIFTNKMLAPYSFVIPVIPNDNQTMYKLSALKDLMGEVSHKLTINEIPKHSHLQATFTGINSGSGGVNELEISGSYGGTMYYDYCANTEHTRIFTRYEGTDDNEHNNMPPYQVAYCWHRID